MKKEKIRELVKKYVREELERERFFRELENACVEALTKAYRAEA